MHKKLLHLGFRLIALAALAAGSGVIAAPAAQAWDAGRIIDDSVFNNTTTMSPGAIQNFLNSQVPTCDTYHAPGSGSQGANPPWVCLKDYSEGGRSAAQIIYDAAQQYSINPQVLLVTLQKENGLITDSWPYPWQYRTAMGFGCPDGSPCDSQWYGFTNQVNQGARHLRNFQLQTAGWTIPHRPGLNFIKYNPNSGCGGSNVNIVNGATAALYSYTPYQPNSAALATKYGSGDGCSAYGNRNFYNYFTDWFGSTYGTPYNWQFVSQTSDRDLSNLPAGQKSTWTVTARNNGTATWTNSGANPVRLAANQPNERVSTFCTTGWSGCGRAATLNESSVAPGQNGTFTFTTQAPSTTGVYNEHFTLIAEGISWMNDTGLNFYVNVVPANLAATVTSGSLPATMITSSNNSVTLRVRNDGNVTWYNNSNFPIDLGTYNPTDRVSPFANGGWIGSTRPARLVESSVAPGQTGTFTFNLTAPAVVNSYTEAYAIVAEGLSWSNQALINQAINVTGSYSGTALDAPTLNMVSGQTTSVTLRYTNTGTGTWSNTGANPVRLGTANDLDRISRFCDSATWSGCNRPVTMNEASVAPGQTGSFTFNIKTSAAQNGNFREYFQPVAEGLQWFGGASLVTVNVAPAHYTWALESQGAWTNSSKTTPVDLSHLSPGDTAWLQLKAKNTGNTTWTNTGANPVDLGTNGPQDRASKLYTSGWLGSTRPARLIEASVAPGATGTFEFPVNATAGTGATNERYNLVAEGISWMNDLGLAYYVNVNQQYAWSLVSQYAYTDSSKSTPTSLTPLSPGQSVYIGMVIKNTGGAAWHNNGGYPLDLATRRPTDRNSPFYAAGWIGANRPARLIEQTVAPGANGTFEFNYTAPTQTGTYLEYFAPVVENIDHLNDIGLNFYTVVR